MLREKLAALKESSGMTTKQISDKSGVPVSTITRVLSGETANPSFEVIRDLTTAMGGSLDEIAEIMGQKPAPDPAPAAAPAFALPDFQQLLTPFYERALAEKNRWIFILFGCVTVLVLFIMGVLLYDILHPNMGWVQY